MADKSEFMKKFGKTLDIAIKFKKVMVKKHLIRARTPCPDCEGKFIHGRISGPRDHFHMSCECRKHQFME